MRLTRVVPQVSVLGEAHAFPFDRMGDDCRGPFGVERQSIERVDDFRHVVSVDFSHFKAKRAPIANPRPAHAGAASFMLSIATSALSSKQRFQFFRRHGVSE